MPTPRGQEAVRAALIEAAADLLAKKSGVSVREIAAKAGVNHGLVHHYFGGKDELERAVLETLAQRQRETLVAAAGDPSTLIDSAIAAARSDDRFWRVLGRMLLDGKPIQRMQSVFPVVERLIGGLEAAGVEDARDHVAEGLASVLGWMMYAPWIQRATGLDGEDAEASFERILRRRVEDLGAAMQGDVGT